MREAIALASRNHELGAWLAKQKTLDEEITATLADIEPSAGLRTRLVQAMECARHARRGITSRRWLAIAATIALLAGATALLLNRGRPDWQAEALATIEQVDSGKLPLDKWSVDLALLREWLGAEKSPTASALPRGMSVLTALGCKLVKIGGKPASIICFTLPDSGEEAHLLVMDADGATPSRPAFESRSGWRMVTWNESGRKLMLASRAPEAALCKMFA